MIRRNAAVMLLAVVCVLWSRVSALVHLPLSQLAQATKTLYGCPINTYTTTLTVGKSNLTLLVDSGSSTLAVASTLCDSGCETVEHRYNVATGIDQDESIQLNYGDGSQLNCEVYRDSVTIGDLTASLLFGAITSASGPVFMPQGCVVIDEAVTSIYDGILGMAFTSLAAPPTQSYFDVLADNGQLTSNLFSMWFCGTGGEMTLGGIDPTLVNDTAAIKWVPITQDDYYLLQTYGLRIASNSMPIVPMNLIVDTGTTQFLLPQYVVTWLDALVGAYPNWYNAFGNQFFTNGDCVRITDTTPPIKNITAGIPLLYVSFQGAMVPLAWADGLVFMIQPLPDIYFYCPGIGATSGDPILGWAALNQYVTFFDLDMNAVGFYPNPIPQCYNNNTILSSAFRSATPALWLTGIMILSVVWQQ